MNYEKLSRDGLYKQIKLLNKKIMILNKKIEVLENEKKNSELLNFPWIGNLGQWHWMIDSNTVIFNDKKVTTLGYTMDEVPENIGHEFFTSKLHPDDYKYVMENMSNHLKGITDAYEVEYRIQKKDGSYIWYYDRGIIVKKDKNGAPLVLSGIVFDISKSKEIEKKLSELALRDELTASYNRRYFIQSVESEMERYNRTGLPFSVVICDIDDFKKINDDFGHLIGDSILKEFVQVIQNHIRSTDVLARWGGDEFVILLINTTSEEAYKVTENLRKLIEEHNFSGGIRLTSSIGIIQYLNGMKIEELIRKADSAMYEAKRNGKNQNCIQHY